MGIHSSLFRAPNSLYLKIAHFKDWLWAICSLKKSFVSDKLVIWANSSQETCESLNKFVFFVCFLFFMPKSESILSLFAYSLIFKEQLERFPKDQLWAICSGLSWQKSKGSDLLFTWAICSFHKQWAKRSKNRWANSQS